MRRLLMILAGGAFALLLLGGSALRTATPSGFRPLGASGFAAVIAGAVMTQGFGCTYLVFEPLDPACASRHFHAGVDLAAPVGTPVFAAADGVCHVVASPGGYGLHLVIQHDPRFLSLYGHLSAVTVTEGQVVTAGTEVGLVGSSGLSTGPHLHFEIRSWDIPVDPTIWLRVLQGGGRPRVAAQA